MISSSLSATEVSTNVVTACVPDSGGTPLSAALVLSAREFEVQVNFDSSGFGGNVCGVCPGGLVVVSHDFFLAFGAGNFYGCCHGLCAGLGWDPAIGSVDLVCR